MPDEYLIEMGLDPGNADFIFMELEKGIQYTYTLIFKYQTLRVNWRVWIEERNGEFFASVWRGDNVILTYTDKAALGRLLNFR